MPCIDCLQNCGDKRTTDRCVEYTGDDIAFLGICKGDTLYQLEFEIVEKLKVLADGTGIDLSSVTIGCDFLNDILNGEDKTLVNLIQMLVTGGCTLRELIQDIQDVIDAPFSVNAPCLSLPASPTRDNVLKAAAEKVCSVNTRVSAIEADYVKQTELCDKVAECLASGPPTQEYTKMPKYVPMAYIGPLSVFDSTGKGLSAFGYDKVYICNGNNNTPDMRGRTAVGANTNVVGPTLDSDVDPSLPDNAGYSIVQGSKKGNYTNTLSTTNMPSHSHPVTDPGHTHSITLTKGYAYTGSPNNSLFGSGDPNHSQTYTYNTDSSVTNITVGSSGNSQPHNNTQPSYGVVWIIYLP